MEERVSYIAGRKQSGSHLHVAQSVARVRSESDNGKDIYNNLNINPRILHLLYDSSYSKPGLRKGISERKLVKWGIDIANQRIPCGFETFEDFEKYILARIDK